MAPSRSQPSRYDRMGWSDALESMSTSVTTEQVWVAFRRRLLSYIRVRSRSDADAEDILQNVFIKVHRHLGSVEDEARLTSWLYRVTHNEIIDSYRRIRPTARDASPTQPTEDVEVNAEQMLAPFLRELIDDLPAKYREALTLTEIEGLTQEAMGDQLGLSVSGAKSRVQRGRALLRDRLLDCCHIELDCRGHVMDYEARTAEPWPQGCPCAPDSD